MDVMLSCQHVLQFKPFHDQFSQIAVVKSSVMNYSVLVGDKLTLDGDPEL